ncbi:glycoside hydrolase family 3 C-terminal domain-containing protein [Pseudolysinimonas sp.]|uniref:beta-glucosidase family protein n=1 Tax=Pseudolysinimonas sp. TaxID=2680009 RepID=UPI002869F84F|nr:glycoside hydrolase family 3 C-terminal domain-containing protein [Pseudolysinimonas sp.]
MSTSDDRLIDLLAQLSLEDKVRLVSGEDFWTTTPLPQIGLRAMVLSDGPSGVRGPVWDERQPSLNLPSATALAASWDPELASRYGAVAASEALRKGVDVVLGPTINLQRSPLGGRHFEAFSEDPELTAALAEAYVRGMQALGIAATPKHYVANDSETDRFTVDVRVDERTLRELYLLPFERTVDAGAWAIMSAYNSVNGPTMTENPLLADPLESEWGFDGVVVSDWTAVRSVASATAAQDLAMPGPAPAWSDALIAAVRDGRVAEAAIDRKVLRLLRLADRVGALEGSAPARIAAAFDGQAFAEEAAIAGTVMVRNDGELPWHRDAIRRIAVIGHNARVARTQGGGSATVIPEHVRSPLDGIRAALPGAEVVFETGAVVQEGVAELPLEQLTNPVTGEHGVVVSFHDSDGRELFREHRRSTALVWFGGDAPIAESRKVVLHTFYTPEADEELRLGFATSNPGRVFVDGELLVEGTPVIEGTDLGAAFLSPPSITAPLSARRGVRRELRAEFDLLPTGTGLDGALSLTVGMTPPDVDPDALIARAVEVAASADVALVVVGTNSRVESEGYDRSDLDLPGRQDDLVRAVAAANPHTVVVVNAGSPVLLPWRDEVAAVLVGFFGGQEFGTAIADVVFGDAEPGGRLPTSWPADLADVPVLDVTPVNGALEYSEGIHIGYRAWLRAGTRPAFPFGFGLGYTTWDWRSIEATAGDDGSVTVHVELANTGDRSGKHVVQVYADRADSAIERPERWLVGFAVVRAAAGEQLAVEVTVPRRRFAHWSDDGWAVEPGSFRLRVGSDVTTLPLAVQIEVPAEVVA